MVIKIKATEQDKKSLLGYVPKPTSTFNNDFLGVVVNKPWGYEYLMFHNKDLSIWLLHIKHGLSTSMHCHPNKKTSLFILSGEAKCSTLDQSFFLKDNDGIIFDKGVFHTTEAKSEEGLFLFEVETPINKQDLYRLNDKFDREKEEYTKNENITNKINEYPYYFIEDKEGETCVFNKYNVLIKDYSNKEELLQDLNKTKPYIGLLLNGDISINDEVIHIGELLSISDMKYSKINSSLRILFLKEIDNCNLKKFVKLSDYVISFFEKKGIKHIFMLPGGGAMHINDSMGKNKNISYVPHLNEQSAGIAADTYSRYTENFGVVSVTTGPAATNIVTPVAAAWSDSIPLFVISGQVKRQDLIKDTGLRINGFQEADITKIVAPITKYCVTVLDAEKIKYYLEKAYYLMMNGRPGPVWLDVPIDVQICKIDENNLIGFDSRELENNEINDNDLNINLDKILNLLKSAKRPVVIVGNGIRLAHGMPEFYEFLNKLKIPLLTTWGAIDYVGDDYNLVYGRPNILGGNRAAHFIMQNSDVLLSVGARLGVQTIGYNSKAFARESKLIIVDIDKNELDKKTLNPYMKINCDAKRFLKNFNLTLNEPINADSDWIKWCDLKKKDYPVIVPEYFNDTNYVNVYAFIDKLSNNLNSEDIIVPTSAGTAYVCMSQTFKLKKGQRFLTSRGMAAMGWDLPSAIGACVASGNKRTISVTGDGGIQMNLQELQTIIAKKLPIKIFVFNNQGYLTIKNTQKNFFEGNYVACNPESSLFLPNMANIAKAYGFPVQLIKYNSEIDEKIKQVLNMDGPVFCEIFTDPDQPVIPKLASRQKPDGTMFSSPIEDLYPFLERKEFLKNMIIKPLGDE